MKTDVTAFRPTGTLLLGFFDPMNSITELLSVALALGARDIGDLSEPEERLVGDCQQAPPDVIDDFRRRINAGGDPLGDSFCEMLSADRRRPMGATYTPAGIVSAMIEWARCRIEPAQVVDPGAGSGRFIVAAARIFPGASLVAVELDPVAAVLLRGHVAAAGFAGRAQIIVGDFRTVQLPPSNGRSLFIGNPPYVRHHLISPDWKNWLVAAARKHGHKASQLSGLHVHFFVALMNAAKSGDVGVLITAAEWLDVNYGQVVRDLMVGEMGGNNIQIIEPGAEPFPGTATTGVITGFEIKSVPAGIGFRRVQGLDDLGTLPTDVFVDRSRLIVEKRWTQLSRVSIERQDGFVELGELCRVHRGQVTGANRIWIEGSHSYGLPSSVMFRSITRAQELFKAGFCLSESSALKRVIDIPTDLDLLDEGDREDVLQFLAFAKREGADSGFVASHRRAWWSVGLRKPAPILATYMARRPPAFVINEVGARHINVAHGLYPREELPNDILRGLAAYLSRAVSVDRGRTYAGGLTKFEPKEMERLLVPDPSLQAENSYGYALH